MDLTKREPSDFSAPAKKAMDLLTVTRNFVIIGSAGLKQSKYYSDIDVNELYQKPTDNETSLDNLLKAFQDKFKRIEAEPTLFISDFKCGMGSDGEPLRWSAADIRRGWKELDDGRRLTFQEALLQKTTCKMDVIAFVDGRFVEVSDNYFIKLGDAANYFPFDFNKNKILNSIEHDYDEYFYAAGNLFKGLKRAFAYWKLKDPEQYKLELKTLLDFFNSPVGLLYQNYSSLGTLLDLIESNPRKPIVREVKKSLQQIITDTPADYREQVADPLTSAFKCSKVAGMVPHLKKAREDLLQITNWLTAQFVLKNRSVAIY